MSNIPLSSHLKRYWKHYFLHWINLHSLIKNGTLGFRSQTFSLSLNFSLSLRSRYIQFAGNPVSEKFILLNEATFQIIVWRRPLY